MSRPKGSKLAPEHVAHLRESHSSAEYKERVGAVWARKMESGWINPRKGSKLPAKTILKLKETLRKKREDEAHRVEASSSPVRLEK